MRKYTGQIKELTIKLILYNLSKIIHVISICISSEVFSRAPDSLKNPLDCRDFSPCSLQSRGYQTDEAQYPKNPHALHRCLASVYYYTGKGCDQQKEMMCLGLVSLNSRDLGMDNSFELTGTNEREVMRKFIEYAETELKMPVLTADTIYRVQMAIKK